MIKKFAPFTAGYVKATVLAPLFVTLEVVLEVMIPLLMSIIVDVGIEGGEFKEGAVYGLIQRLTTALGFEAGTLGFVVFIGGMMVLMAILSLFFGAMSGRYAAVAGNGFARNLRRGLFAKVQDFSFYNVDKFSTASLVTRLTVDVTNTQNAFQMIIRICVRSPLMLIFASVMAFTVNWELALVFLVAIPFFGVSLFFIATRAFKYFKRMFKRYDEHNLQLQENFIGIRVIKAYVREDHETESFRQKTRQLREATLKAERIIILNAPLMQFSMYATMIAIYWLAGRKIVFGEMESGEMLLFISYVTQILMSLMMISMFMVMIVMSRASISRISEVLDEKIDITDDSADDSLRVKNGDISFNDVGFSYSKNPDHLTLSNIDLDIKSGETVGILGGTGTGKTTLVQLIPRLYDITCGELKVGGRSVKDYSIHELRESVAMVLQKNVLFSGTIMDNLKWGDANATDEEVYNACKAAQAHSFIMSFPNGYQTDLGQGGVNLSGGQKQRICIARALLKKPKILILDDSTSAVDTATDAEIRRAFKETINDTTVLIIAQRVNSVIDADKIVIMDKGRINAVGTHDELLKTNKIYREVYNSQTHEFDGEGGAVNG